MLFQLAVLYTATCGTITQAGAYTAPSVGPCKVIARDGALADTALVTVVAQGTTPTGVPFGPFAFWSSNTTVYAGPAPFTASIGQNNPGGIVAQITAARTMGLHLVLCLAGCAHAPVTTNGAFDLVKWKAAVALYNTAAIRTAITQAVADGTVLGNGLMDEPEHFTWGGVPTKAMLDGMATYARQFFPTLPMGVHTGPGGYKWRASEHYATLDFVANQYEWRAGPITTWLAAVRAQNAPDSVALAFSMNALAGGVQDRDGVWSCDGPGQAGLSLQSPWCRAPADSVRAWGRYLGPQGCFMVMWTYEATYFDRADNQSAFRDIAASLAVAPRKSCRRGGA